MLHLLRFSSLVTQPTWYYTDPFSPFEKGFTYSPHSKQFSSFPIASDIFLNNSLLSRANISEFVPVILWKRERRDWICNSTLKFKTLKKCWHRFNCHSVCKHVCQCPRVSCTPQSGENTGKSTILTVRKGIKQLLLTRHSHLHNMIRDSSMYNLIMDNI